MMIRDAKEKDIPRILELLKQVLQIHADIRPDNFYSGYNKIYHRRIERDFEE